MSWDKVRVYITILFRKVAYGGQEVGRRKGVEEVVVIWAESLTLVWFA